MFDKSTCFKQVCQLLLSLIVATSFPVSIKLIPFVYDNITQAKLTYFFNLGGLLRCFFQPYSDYKFLYTFHKVGPHHSSTPRFETFEIRGDPERQFWPRRVCRRSKAVCFKVIPWYKNLR